MNHSELERLINLSQKTGDTLIIADPHGNQSVVVMPVEKYEAILGVAEVMDEEDFYEDFDGMPEDVPHEMPPEGLDQVMEPEMMSEPVFDEPPIPPQMEGEKEEKAGDFDGEEERFYLEPIE